MATAYIPGPSLTTAIAEQGPFDEAGTLRLGAGLAAGLAAIHACGLIHRDLKPGNIILGTDGPFIIDFGIAKHMGMTSMTGSGVIIGTLRYMSPEQLNGQDLTPLSDVFSLGAVLACAATGHDPFSAPSIPAVITRILHDPPDLSPLTGALRDLIASCLAKDATERPSVADLLAQFTALDDSTGNALVQAAQAATDSARPATGTLSVPALPIAAATPAGGQPDVLPTRPPQPAAAPHGEPAADGRGRWYRRPAILAAAVAVVVAGVAVPSVLLFGGPSRTTGTTRAARTTCAAPAPLLSGGWLD